MRKFVRSQQSVRYVMTRDEVLDLIRSYFDANDYGHFRFDDVEIDDDGAMFSIPITPKKKEVEVEEPMS